MMEGAAVEGNALARETPPVDFGQSQGEGSRRKTPVLPIVLAALCALLAMACALLIWNSSAKGDTGSYIVPHDGMSDEEAQAMLNEQAESSRITVSLSPEMQLREDGSLRVNFLVEEPNNGFSERFEVEQDGRIVYASGPVKPGFGIEWCEAPQAHAGPAIATVYALDEQGRDRGNPVSVELQIAAVHADTRQ